MQVTERYMEENGISRKLLEQMVMREGPDTDRVFGRQRKAVQKAIEGGETVTIREHRNIRRNDPCPCGSGVKFKKCCGRNIAASDTRIQ